MELFNLGHLLLVIFLVTSTSAPLTAVTNRDSENQLDFDVDVENYEAVTLDELEEFKSSIDALDIQRPAFMSSNGYLSRWLRLCDHDVPCAVSKLAATLKWRREEKIDQILDEDFSRLEQSLPGGLEGFDVGGRPVFWSPSGSYDVRKVILGGPKEVAHYERYLYRGFELNEWVIHEKGGHGHNNVSQMVAIFDLKGFNLKQGGCLRCAQLLAKITSNIEAHYPLMFYRVYIINSPSIFLPLMKIMRAVMNGPTQKSIHAFGYDRGEWGPALLRQIPADQLSEEYGGKRSRSGGYDRVEVLWGFLRELRQQRRGRAEEDTSKLVELPPVNQTLKTEASELGFGPTPKAASGNASPLSENHGHHHHHHYEQNGRATATLPEAQSSFSSSSSIPAVSFGHSVWALSVSTVLYFILYNSIPNFTLMM